MAKKIEERIGPNVIIDDKGNVAGFEEKNLSILPEGYTRHLIDEYPTHSDIRTFIWDKNKKKLSKKSQEEINLIKEHTVNKSQNYLRLKHNINVQTKIMAAESLQESTDDDYSEIIKNLRSQLRRS